MASITAQEIGGEKVEAVTDFTFSKITAAMKLRHLLLGRKVMTILDRISKSREGWVLQNWCFGIVVLEKTIESPNWKIKSVNLKGINPEYYLEAPLLELWHPILWPLDARSWLTGKDLCWEDWRQKREAKEEMVRQHHQRNGHESEHTLRDSRGQRSLVCCSQRGLRAGHNSATEQHNKKSHKHNAHWLKDSFAKSKFGDMTSFNWTIKILTEKRACDIQHV